MHFHFILYSFINITVSPKTLVLDFLCAILLLIYMDLSFDLSEYFLDYIPLNIVALWVLCAV